MPHPPCVLVVIGPSGAGKSSVIRELHRRHVIRVQPTWTTRPPRAEEEGGSLEHRFISDREFDDLRRTAFFLQTGAVTGLPFRYGLPAFVPSDVGPVNSVILRAPYVEPFRQRVPSVVVYQIDQTCVRSARHLRDRGGPASELRSRIRDNQVESIGGARLAHRTFRNDGTLECLTESIAAAMSIDFPGRLSSTSGAVAS